MERARAAEYLSRRGEDGLVDFQQSKAAAMRFVVIGITTMDYVLG
jgi:hypothetical protein